MLEDTVYWVLNIESTGLRKSMKHSIFLFKSYDNALYYYNIFFYKDVTDRILAALSH